MPTSIKILGFCNINALTVFIKIAALYRAYLNAYTAAADEKARMKKYAENYPSAFVRITKNIAKANTGTHDAKAIIITP